MLVTIYFHLVMLCMVWEGENLLGRQHIMVVGVGDGEESDYKGAAKGSLEGDDRYPNGGGRHTYQNLDIFLIHHFQFLHWLSMVKTEETSGRSGSIYLQFEFKSRKWSRN
jgi:hypothetical protein